MGMAHRHGWQIKGCSWECDAAAAALPTPVSKLCGACEGVFAVPCSVHIRRHDWRGCLRYLESGTGDTVWRMRDDLPGAPQELAGERCL